MSRSCVYCDYDLLWPRHREDDGRVFHNHSGTNTRVQCTEPGRATSEEIADELRNEGANERYRG